MLTLQNGISARSAEARSDNMGVAAIKRDVQKEDMVNSANEYATAHIGQQATQADATAAQQAAAFYGTPDWYGPHYDWDWNFGVQWTLPQWYYVYMYNTWPNQRDTWQGSFNGNVNSFNRNCVALIC